MFLEGFGLGFAPVVGVEPRQLQGTELSGEKELAPQVGLEPTTLRLTAECSTIELLRSKTGGICKFITPKPWPEVNMPALC